MVFKIRTIRLLLALFSLPVVFLIRLISPFILIRFFEFKPSCMGSLAVYPELYCCLKDKIYTKKRVLDIFFVRDKVISNQQLFLMWARIFPKIHTFLSFFLENISYVNKKIPFSENYFFDKYFQVSSHRKLLGSTQSHLHFTEEEKQRGKSGLQSIGLPPDAKLVCLLVRDNAYMAEHRPGMDDSLNNCRNSDINNFVLMAEEIADRGYYVIRMGAKVAAPLITNHKKIIDYAYNGLRTDFMDIYIASKCSFCISTGSGWDLVPNYLFRKPTALVNTPAIGDIIACAPWFYLATVKKYYDLSTRQELSVREIFERGLIHAHSKGRGGFQSEGIELIENTPEENRDVAIEMIERLEGTWQSKPGDDELQKLFWRFFIDKPVDKYPLYYSTIFLRNNPEWLL